MYIYIHTVIISPLLNLCKFNNSIFLKLCCFIDIFRFITKEEYNTLAGLLQWIAFQPSAFAVGGFVVNISEILDPSLIIMLLSVIMINYKL